MDFEVILITLFTIASAVALGARWLRVPYTVALVVAGLLLGTVHVIQPPHLTRDLLFTVFLPALLYEAAFHLEFKNYWRNQLAIHALAVPGVVAIILLTAGLLTPAVNAMHMAVRFTFQSGLVFGAVVAATDPIAVVGLFKSLGAPRRLRALVEGESLLNDGTAIVLFTLILDVATGHQTTVLLAALSFLKVVGLGIFIGGGIGLASAWITQRVDDPMIEITLTTIAAYGSFLAAEHFGGSGVIATVTAGMLGGSYAARTGMAPSTRIAVETFWEYAAFALNSIVFLLIGFAVRIEQLMHYWQPILAAWLVMMLGRALVVLGVSLLMRGRRQRLPWRWSVVLTWGGLRGGLSMVLVLGLPESLPHRELLVNVTFGVVLLSILAQGLTMAPLLRWLRLAGGRSASSEYDECSGALLAQRAALRDLERMERERRGPAGVLDPLREEYAARVAATQERLGALQGQDGVSHDEVVHAARRQLVMVEKEEIIRAHHEGRLTHAAFDRLVKDADARLLEIEELGEREDPA